MTTDQALIAAIRENQHDTVSLGERLAEILADAWAERFAPESEVA